MSPDELPPGPVPGQAVPHPSNPSWLAHEDGGPLFVCGPGSPEDFLYRGRRRPDGTREGDQDALIARLAGTGANSVYIQAVRSHGGDGGPDHNPFVDSDPARGLDARILDQWEGWFDALEAEGVVIHLFLYDDGARIWETGDVVGPEEGAFVRALVDRFEHHPLLIWVVAEEYEERYTPARVSALAREILEADDHDHIVAVHKQVGLEFDEFRAEPAIGQLAVQWRGSYQNVFEGTSTLRRRFEGRKSINMAEIQGHGSGREARLKNWAAAMGGSAEVLELGMDIAGTSISDLRDCGRQVRFMESTGLGSLSPRPDRAAAGSWVLSDAPGTERIVFVPTGAGELLVPDLPAGRYTVRWIDPGSDWSEEDVLTHPGGDLRLVRPGPVRGGEVALHLRTPG